MRLRVICVLFAAVALAPADTIRLKNGRTIVADHVTQANGRLEYQIGDDVYRIPLSLVDKVESGGTPVTSASAPRGSEKDAKPAGEAAAIVADLPPLTSQLPPQAADVEARVLRDGRLDTEALRAIELQGNAPVTAFALTIAGAYEQRLGDLDRAAGYFRRGLDLQPDSALLHARYAGVLLSRERYSEALPHAERAVKLEPDSPDYLALLGFVYFFSDRTKEAIAPWQRSLAIRPNDLVRRNLAKAQRELNAESGFGQQESGHFTLHYEGRESPAELRRELLVALEADYTDLAREFGVEPRENVPVVLYTNQAFFDVTQAPSWADAINDGKLRIPLDHVTSLTPDLARVLKHELAHTFINQITRGRAPQWLHEGVAQLMEPRDVAPIGPNLARMFAATSYVPFNMLEASFTGMHGEQAGVAYAESLAAADYIRATYGMSDLVRILQRIGEGAATEAALRATIHSGYAGFEQELGAYLQRTYGK